MIEWIDTHSHLAMLKHSPLEEILTRAKDAGVVQMVSVATDYPSWESNRELSEKHSHIYHSIGIHPHDAKDWNTVKDKFIPFYQSLKNPAKCVGVGELGLDYHYNHSTKEDQIQCLEDQFEFAKQLKLPVIIHCRDAFDDLFASTRKVGLSSRTGVMHCFTGNSEQAKEALDLGLKISFSGILTFKTADTLREAAKTIPLSEILLETDCPYLAPMPHRGKPNEPALMPDTGRYLALVKGLSISEIAAATTANARKFWGI